MWIGIDRTSATDPVRNVRFLWPGTEPSYATQPFNVAFLQKVAPFSVLRYMDWGATNGSPVVEWADRAHVDDVQYGRANGVPIEVMIDLANTLHVDPWFCVPHQASDDYVRQFATLVHARLDPGLHPHIEYSNEVWNTGFAQTGWAIAQSTRLDLPTSYGHAFGVLWQAREQIFKIFQQVWGGRQRPHRPGHRRPGGVDAVPGQRAGLRRHRRQRRRARRRSVFQASAADDPAMSPPR